MMVNRHACPVEDCDTAVDYLSREGALACDEHDEPLEFVGKAGCVRGLKEGQMPVEDVRELAERWRDFAGAWGRERYGKGVGDGIEVCADELERLADELEHDDLERRDVRQLGTEGEDGE